jgi:hypothetical protein
VFHESPNGAFGGIAEIAVRGHRLISDIIDGEEVLQIGRCLVVESLELWFDIVAIIDVTDHHIRVSFAGSDREFSCQVGVELTLIDYDCAHEVGLCAQVCIR